MSDDWNSGAPPLKPEFNNKANSGQEQPQASEAARPMVTRDQARQLEQELQAPPEQTLDYRPGNASAWRDAQDQVRDEKAAQLAQVKARLKARSQKAREDFDNSR